MKLIKNKFFNSSKLLKTKIIKKNFSLKIISFFKINTFKTK